MEITIEELKAFSPDITQAINNLLEQLNPNSRTLSGEDVKAITEESSNRFFVARESINSKIVGMLMLIVLSVPCGKKGFLEDIVVDKNYQGKGIGTRLITQAIDQARKEGVVRLDFTSNPKREAANRLYQHLGFKKRDTNVYRIEL